MGKSPGKWIKTVLFGKKSSKSTSSSNILVPLVSEKGVPCNFDASLPIIEGVNLQNSPKLNIIDKPEITKLEQATIKVQATFRGYLARRAFIALKGIIRLQALIRGHLVRKQAVITLHTMYALVKFQALVRGRKVRNFYPGLKITGIKKMEFSRANVSFELQKLAINSFVRKLLNSFPNATPMSLQYDSTDPNSLQNWLIRWSLLSFWVPLAQTNLPTSKLTARIAPIKKQPQLDLEQVKRNLRKITASSGIVLEKLDVKLVGPTKVFDEDVSELVEEAQSEPLIVEKEEMDEINEENGLEKIRKEEYVENVLENTKALPSYMAATKSAKAKVRGQNGNINENGFIRRHSLPNSSPRVPRLVQVKGKSGSKSNKSVLSPTDDKGPGWRR